MLQQKRLLSGPVAQAGQPSKEISAYFEQLKETITYKNENQANKSQSTFVND